MKQIKLNINEDEYNKIVYLSEKFGMTASAYSKMMALNAGNIITVNNKSIEEHNKKVDEVIYSLRSLISVIRQTNEAYNPDIKYILSCMIDLSQSENQFLKEIRMERSDIKKGVEKAIEKVVKDRIKKDGE